MDFNLEQVIRAYALEKLHGRVQGIQGLFEDELREKISDGSIEFGESNGLMQKQDINDLSDERRGRAEVYTRVASFLSANDGQTFDSSLDDLMNVFANEGIAFEKDHAMESDAHTEGKIRGYRAASNVIEEAVRLQNSVEQMDKNEMQSQKEKANHLDLDFEGLDDTLDLGQ